MKKVFSLLLILFITLGCFAQSFNARSGGTKASIRSQAGVYGNVFILLGTDCAPGIFMWDTLSTSIDDSANVFKTPANIGRWIRLTVPPTPVPPGTYNIVTYTNRNGVDSVSYGRDTTIVHYPDTLASFATKKDFSKALKNLDTVGLVATKSNLSMFVSTSSSYANPAFISSLPANKISGLASVAISGSYNDLTNKPNISDSTKIFKTYNRNGFMSGQLKVFIDSVSPTVALNDTIDISGAGFSNIYDIHVTVESNQTSPTTIPLICVKNHTLNKVYVNLLQSNNVLVQATSLPLTITGLQPLQSLTGIKIYITVFGN